MSDKYANYVGLERNEPTKNYRIRKRIRKSNTAVIAPHGGGIEPGTSDIAEAIAGKDHSFYAFEGRKRHNNNRDLHITSEHFDEPRCLAVIRGAKRVISIHGAKRDEKVVYLGGLDNACLSRIRDSLEQHGFEVGKDTPSRLQGRSVWNICNRGRTRRGVQIEIGKASRRSFFRALSANGRKKRTERFWEFVCAIRDALR